MKIRIVSPPGVFLNSEGSLVFPATGEEVEVPGVQGKALIAAGFAEAVGAIAKAQAGATRTRKPKRTTEGKAPDETR